LPEQSACWLKNLCCVLWIPNKYSDLIVAVIHDKNYHNLYKFSISALYFLLTHCPHIVDIKFHQNSKLCTVQLGLFLESYKIPVSAPLFIRI